MRTIERLKGLKKWTKENLCAGRSMKTFGENMNIADVVWKEPEVYLAWSPTRLDSTGPVREDVANTCPSIVIMPAQTYAKYMEEKRFDRYSGIHRPQEMGQHLAVDMLFNVYDPGVRLEGFADSVGDGGHGLDMSLMQEGTEDGLTALLEWMDDCMKCLLRDKFIPKTDLWVEESTMTYSLYTDQSYVVDRRPVFHGFVRVSFGCYADEGVNPDIDQYLR